jgi:methylmalonyl-CoA mutase
LDKELNLLKEFAPPSYEEWRKAVEESLKGADFDKVMNTRTDEGITLKPIYRKEDIADLPFLKSLPGKSPYVRGSDPHRFLRSGWLIAQSHTESDPKKLNEEILRELNLGLTAVNIALAHNDSESGLRLDSQETLAKVLTGIDLKAAPLFLQLDTCEKVILEWLEQYAKERDIDFTTLEAGVGFDPSGEFARKGYLEQSLEETWQIMLDAVRWAVDKAPLNRLLSIDATVYGDAGANSVQELAFALSTAIGYIQGLQYSGFEIDQLAALFQVKLSLGPNFFMEIAKIRAFRLIWAEMIRAFGGSDASQKVWIHAKTASFDKTLYDAYVNVLRSATEGFSGVIGGADSLEIGRFDELSGPESEFSSRLARNQQLILKEEAHFGKVIDPAGGCYYIEWLTNELAEKAWSLMQEIEGAGGMVRSVRAGRIQEMIAKTAQSRIADVHKRKSVFVGVNMFANPEEKVNVPTAAAKSNSITKAVETSSGPLPKLRAVEELETLRHLIEISSANKKIFLLNMGSIAEYKARADFALGFFQVCGFEVINPDGFTSVEDAVRAGKESGAAAFCVCSKDDKYKEIVPQICELLKGEKLILAGYPADMAETYKHAGINVFIHIRADIFDTLRDIATLMGVIA